MVLNGYLMNNRLCSNREHCTEACHAFAQMFRVVWPKSLRNAHRKAAIFTAVDLRCPNSIHSSQPVLIPTGLYLLACTTKFRIIDICSSQELSTFLWQCSKLERDFLSQIENFKQVIKSFLTFLLVACTPENSNASHALNSVHLKWLQI